MVENKRIVVLVVEDEWLVRMDLVDILQSAAWTTYEAGNASEAIAVLEQHDEMQVVFTDIQMPGDMDGLALSRYVRDRWPPTIIVVCSGNERPGADEMPRDAAFIPKPYDRSALDKMLQTIRARLPG